MKSTLIRNLMTVIAVISLGGIVANTSIRIGGNKYDDAIREAVDKLGLKERKIPDFDNPEWSKENEGAGVVLDKVVNLENNKTTDGHEAGFSFLTSWTLEKNKGNVFYNVDFRYIGQKLGRAIRGVEISWSNPTTSDARERAKKFSKQMGWDKDSN